MLWNLDKSGDLSHGNAIVEAVNVSQWVANGKESVTKRHKDGKVEPIGFQFKMSTSVFCRVVPEIQRWMRQSLLRHTELLEGQSQSIVQYIQCCLYDAVRTAVLQKCTVQNNTNESKAKSINKKFYDNWLHAHLMRIMHVVNKAMSSGITDELFYIAFRTKSHRSPIKRCWCHLIMYACHLF